MINHQVLALGYWLLSLEDLPVRLFLAPSLEFLCGQQGFSMGENIRPKLPDRAFLLDEFEFKPNKQFNDDLEKWFKIKEDAKKLIVTTGTPFPEFEWQRKYLGEWKMDKRKVNGECFPGGEFKVRGDFVPFTDFDGPEIKDQKPQLPTTIWTVGREVFDLTHGYGIVKDYEQSETSDEDHYPVEVDFIDIDGVVKTEWYDHDGNSFHHGDKQLFLGKEEAIKHVSGYKRIISFEQWFLFYDDGTFFSYDKENICDNAPFHQHKSLVKKHVVRWQVAK